MSNAKILIVEDDRKISEALKDYLERAEFNVVIRSTGKNVVKEVKQNPPDLILLDILLPDKDGMTVCREIRSFSNVPIIFITAKVEPIDRLSGLELGADDYICKPFIPLEVVARVKAVMRRACPDLGERRLELGPVLLDDHAHEVRVTGKAVELTPIEYNLLKTMIVQPDRVFTRSDLITKIQKESYLGYERTIDNHIKNLRKKIEVHSQGLRIIHTVHGIGYKCSVK